jgi:hypothetical protein
MHNARHNRISHLVVGLTLTAAVSLVAAQNNKVSVGDLVEIVSGMGPTLGEVIDGPDPSNYILLQIPTGKKVPVNAGKVRLVQKAGTPNAAINAGEPVSWVDGNVRENGNVVKVNGDWCQVKSPTATTIGWVECKSLRTAAQTAAPKAADKPTAGAGADKAVAIKLPGNWENADGMTKLEFQAGNKCYISISSMTSACTYKQTAAGVTVTMDGEDMVFMANDDGSLSNAPNADMPVRLKKK